MRKRLLSALLALCMVLTLLPGTVFAAGKPSGGQTFEGWAEPMTATLETSAGSSVRPLALDKDGNAALKEGPHVDWIDRIDIPDYARDFYDTLVEASDNDGYLDYLIDDKYYNTTESNNYKDLKVGDLYYASGETAIVAAVIEDVSYDTTAYSEKSKSDSSAWPDEVDAAYDEAKQYIIAANSAFNRDHNEVFWLNNGISWSGSFSGGSGKATVWIWVYITDQRAFEEEDIKAAIDAMEGNIDAILEKAPTDAGRYETLAYFNEWLTTHNEYNSDLSNGPWDMRKASNALAGNTGEDGPVCEGYARAFKVLCDRAEIPCVLVDGDAINAIDDLEPEGHMWNYVQMKDGKWYAVDVTWNDPVYTYNGVPQTGAKSGGETNKWLLLGANTLVNTGLSFIESHPVSNRVTTDGVSFTNGPALNPTAYAELTYSGMLPETLEAGAAVNLTLSRSPTRDNELSVYTYAVTGGTLPAGLTLNGSVISGTLTDAVTEQTTVTVTLREDGTAAADCNIVFLGDEGEDPDQPGPGEDPDQPGPDDELTKLGTPANLEWGKQYLPDWSWSEELGDYSTWKAEDVPGMISWKAASPNQNQARLEIFREGEQKPVVTSIMDFGSGPAPEYYSVDSFIWGEYDSGTYYFTVQSLGDGIEYSDSDVATSKPWTYVKPAVKLPAVTAGGWSVDSPVSGPGYEWAEEGTVYANWTEVAHEVCGGYEVAFAFSEAAGGEKKDLGGNYGISDLFIDLRDDLVLREGIGYYYFRVRALTADITQYQNGPWSEWSEAYYNGTDLRQEVEDALNDIDTETATPQEIIEAVQDIEGLYEAMLADQNAQRDGEESSGILERLTELEDKVGGPADVEAAGTLTGYDPAGASVVGANLNKENPDDVITLVVDAPEEEHTIPELYNQTLAVSFSMELQDENGDNPYEGKALEVPVQVTLPIPTETINPRFLTILHYAQDGTYETIKPYVFQDENGKWFASFVLDHFSDFAMVQEISYTVTVSASPAAGGTVTGAGSYADGASVTVTASANSGYRFAGWTENGVTVSASAAYTFPATADRALTAVFERTENDTYVPAPTPANPSYPVTVSAASNGTVTVLPTSAQSGATVTITASPDDGYTTGSVTVTDSNGNRIPVTSSGDGTYTFTMPGSQVTVSVTFTAIETPWTNPFSDVTERDWFYDEVAYAVQNGLMNGVGGGRFNPYGTTTRGMVMTILARMMGVDTSGGAVWYEKGMAWAVENGVSDGTRPGGTITREQLAVMLYRYAGRPEADVSILSSYPDGSRVHTWTDFPEAMAWAVKHGIITGTSAGTLDPGRATSRAETATILMRFCQNVLN